MSPATTSTARAARPRKSAANRTVSNPNGSKQDRTKDDDTVELTRLSVNLNAETAAALNEIRERRGISLTEAVRRAIAVLKFIEDEIQNGNTVQSTDGAKTRELMLIY